ncbi:uncharacterized protein [Elaeis guineensis]|uniref:Uncharacterized protein LOC105044326 isoform X2 n=1 Tax=Elaeis guineensis var. tenera TaxID=51953 RepID=A0A6I9R6F3_ELAGV|nr:uncharacterized protein LOC105044326 isoform X2 [Elaeis guineensis]
MGIGSMACSYSKSNQIFSNPSPFRTPINRQSATTYIDVKHHCVCSMIKLRCENLTVVTQRKLFIAKAKASSDGPPETSSAKSTEKKGTIVGAVSLIVGTSIGSGILALPQRTSPAGFIPSAASMIVCWVFLVIEALLLAETNIQLRKKERKDEEGRGGDLEVLSLRTMAQDTLGEWGGNLATITYLFLAYTSMVAYTSKSGEVLSRVVDLPPSISGNLFTLLMALLILLGGTRITDQVNRWLTASMIGLLVTIEVVAISFGGGSYPIMEISNWEKVPPTIPVIIFSLVYHDIAPVICAYLGGDLPRVRFSIILGSLVPLLALLVWDDIALSLSSHFDGADPVDLLTSGKWSSMLPMVETFSLLAVGTSLIGTLLGFTQFFIEQLIDLSVFTSAQTKDELKAAKTGNCNARRWWENSKLSLLATSLVIFPSMLISIIVPDAFSVATDIAGGYCMIILYGVLPPTMAWAMHFGLSDGDADLHEDKSFKGHSSTSAQGPVARFSISTKTSSNKKLKGEPLCS